MAMTEFIIDLENVEKASLTPKQLLSFNSIPLREKIVRCRDCKLLEDGWLCLWSMHDMSRELDGFCSQGEHKEVDNG